MKAVTTTPTVPAARGDAFLDYDLSRAAKTRAARAIEAVHRAYHEPGGLKESIMKVQEQNTAVSQHIFDLAVYASESTMTSELARAQFVTMCEYAEAKYKTAHNVDNLKDVLPVWAVYKSGILRGVKLGLKPPDYKTEYDYRRAVMEKVRAELPGPAAPAASVERTSAVPGPVDLSEIEQWLGSTAIHDTLRTLLARVILSVEFLKPRSVTKAEAILRKACDDLAPAVDQRKLAA